MDRILLASDSSATSDRALDRAWALSRILPATLQLTHVLHEDFVAGFPSGEAENRVRLRIARDLADAGYGVLPIHLHTGEAAAGIAAVARDVGATLVVVGQSADASLRSLLRGTTIDRTIRAVGCPVLVVKRRAKRSYQRIAVAFDGGEVSYRIFDRALRWFPGAAFNAVTVRDAQAAPSRGTFAETVEAIRLAAGHPGPVTLSELQGSRAEPVLHGALTAIEPDLVVLGTQGRGAAATLLLGSVALSLLETLPTDILVGR
jgi:nucleotide-binding universal stress UspA family protein